MSQPRYSVFSMESRFRVPSYGQNCQKADRSFCVEGPMTATMLEILCELETQTMVSVKVNHAL